MSDRSRQALNVVFALTQAAAPALPALGFGITVGARDNFQSPAEVPAPWAFSIWGVIFALAIAYALYQALPRNRERTLLQRTGTGSWVLFLLATVWMVIAQLEGPSVVLAVIIAAMLVIALRILMTALPEARVEGGLLQALTVPLFGLYAGWLTLATFLNISSALRDAGIAPFGDPAWLYPAGVVGLAGLLAIAVSARIRGSFWYAAAVIWGLIGVYMHNQGSDMALVGYAAAGLAVVLAALTVIARRA